MTTTSPGTKFGTWTVLRKIGEGGNGVVWHCEDHSGRQGALKVLKAYLLEAVRDPADQEKRHRRAQRFCDEIKFMRANPDMVGVVAHFDSCLPAEPSPENPPWLVMPIGIPLLEFLAAGPRPLRRTIELFKDLAVALANVHALGASHRDVKPENILIFDGKACLADFGLVDFPGKDMNTATTEIMGPLFFVAPEMRSNHESADYRAGDVYSLAKSMWVAATGQTYPLPGEQRLGVPGLSLSAYVTDTRAVLLDRIIDLSTRHAPTERPTSSAFATELAAWLDERTTNAEPLRRVVEIARSIEPTAAREKIANRERDFWKSSGLQLLQEAEIQIGPLALALNELHFEDPDGREIPTRIITGETNRLWDQWTYPKVLVRDDVDTWWHGGTGTISQFLSTSGTALLITGVRVLISNAGSVTICAAIVCTGGGGGADCEILWTDRREATVGSAIAQSSLVDVLNAMQENIPSAVERLASMIRLIVDSSTQVAERSSQRP